jgi:hypothetical protein
MVIIKCLSYAKTVPLYTISIFLHNFLQSGHSIQWNSFGIAETPDDGCLRPKHVVKRKSDRNSCIIEGIILCIKDILMQRDA